MPVAPIQRLTKIPQIPTDRAAARAWRVYDLLKPEQRLVARAAGGLAGAALAVGLPHEIMGRIFDVWRLAFMDLATREHAGKSPAELGAAVDNIAAAAAFVATAAARSAREESSPGAESLTGSGAPCDS